MVVVDDDLKYCSKLDGSKTQSATFLIGEPRLKIIIDTCSCHNTYLLSLLFLAQAKILPNYT
jgi:hypothetical protein